MQIGKNKLKGKLIIPSDSIGLIVFAYGSGSSRNSPRNKFVADYLVRRGYACFLFDLLSEQEDELYINRFDIDLLASRLSYATSEVKKYFIQENIPVFYFGSSTGAAAAIQSAVLLKGEIKGIVSRGGRADLVEKYLHKLNTPILFLVGGFDTELLKSHEEFLKLIQCRKKLIIIAEAGHLFEEEGKLNEVAEHATDWIQQLSPAEKEIA